MVVNARQQQLPPTVEFSDEDDLRLFESCYDYGDYDLAGDIVRIKHNDPEVTSLTLDTEEMADEMGEAAAGRLGEIIGQSTYLKHLNFCPEGVDVEPICAGLQHNRSIQRVEFDCLHLADSGRMNSLTPFLRHSPILKSISLQHCDIGSTSLDVLSRALSDRLGNTLEELDLNDNPIGDVGLEGLFQSLDGGTQLRKLGLRVCGMGRRACISLAQLLGNPEAKLTELYVQNNFIDDESAVVLAGSLASNKKLLKLNLYGNNKIDADGWSALLQLVCDTCSIDGVICSNHVLGTLLTRINGDSNKASFIQALGKDDGNLLNASMNINYNNPFEFEKDLVVRQKLIWGHVRGDLNLGTAPDTDAGAMPCILAWFGNESGLVQYHDPPLAPAEIRKARLGAIFRILQRRPDLCSFRGAVPDAQRAAEDAIGTLCAMDESILDLLTPGNLKEKVAKFQKLCREIDGPGNGIGTKRCRV